MTEALRFETLLTFYFNHRRKYKQAAIRRAYRDLNRTLPLGEETQPDRDKQRKEIEDLLIQELGKLLEHKCANQNAFDNYHREMCGKIRSKWDQLTVGHIQKWVNMTLKYWLIIGGEHIEGIELNAPFFHIPIDSVVLKHIFGEKYPSTPWSKINDYNAYFRYQETFREKHPNEVPIEYEAKLFNKSS